MNHIGHHLTHFVHHYVLGIAFSAASAILILAAVFEQLGLSEQSPTTLIGFIIAHEVVFTGAVLCIFIAGVTAMWPPGQPGGGGFYGWAYRFGRALIPMAETFLEHRLPPAVPPSRPGQITQVSRVTEEVATSQPAPAQPAPAQK
jgi:hypothetical protein